MSKLKAFLIIITVVGLTFAAICLWAGASNEQVRQENQSNPDFVGPIYTPTP